MDPTDPRSLRQTFGRFATGITVVSTATETGVHAMTLNAFMPLSLNPPLVAVSLASQSRIAEYVRESGRFAVNVLSSDQHAVSQHFAGQRVLDGLPEFVWHDGIPLLTLAAAQIGARVRRELVTGDHVLFEGRVVYLADAQREPIVFHGGKYRTLSADYQPTQYVDMWSMFDVVP